MRLSLLSVSTSLLITACGAADPADGGSNPYGTGTPENPVPAVNTPYRVVNTVDFTIEAVLPPQGELVVSTLRTFSTNPARALISIAGEAGVPAVETLYNLLPDALTNRLEGWVNDEIAKVKINGRPVTEYAAQVVSYAEIALTQFAVDSEISIEGTEVTHRLTALDLGPTGLVDIRIPIGGLAGDILTQQPELTVADGGAISFGEQHFGLNYGEYAWQGLEAASTAVFGGTIRETLGTAMNCPNIAQKVADRCYFGVCVGHETEIRQICEGGLDAIVNLAHNRMADMRLEALHLQAGDARLVDTDGDGLADQIVEGSWNAELNLGLGLRHAPAVFVGTR